MKYFMSAVFLSIFLLAFAVSSALTQYNTLSHLNSDGKDGIAIVTSKECSNHGRVSWELPLSGKIIRGTSMGCGFNSQCEDIPIGSALTIRYIEGEPPVYDCGSITDKAHEMLLMICIMIGACVFFLVFGAYKDRKERADA
jgi:hypothetical protein